MATNLFGASTDPIGQTVRIANVPFQVVGVADAKGQSASGNDYDDVAYVPVTTFLAKIQGGLQKFIPGTILIEVASDDVTAGSQQRISALLRDRHGIPRRRRRRLHDQEPDRDRVAQAGEHARR